MHPVTGSAHDLPPEPEPDVQAALTVLAHRPHRPQRQAIDLNGLHLTRARLNDANLTGATLYGADLTRAWLTGANLTGALLGPSPSAVPDGWIVIDSHTGRLERAPGHDHQE